MRLLRSGGLLATLLLLTSGSARPADAAPVPKAAAPAAVPVVMFSDFHFDPFHDPAKVQRLRSAPIADWQKVLAEPDAATREQDFAALSKTCQSRGVDTPWALLESSLTAARLKSPHALFVTVSGDLLVHNFECRFRNLAGGASEAEQSEFAAKTVAYVAGELHRVFGSTPVYLTLGNNDSGCGDNLESPDSAFLHSVARSFADDIEPRGRDDVMQVFPAQGNYSVTMPRPVVRGRLIVLQDTFLSTSYERCDRKRDAAPGAEQLGWLRSELTAAHARHEQVWVMAHIPPGVNMYATLRARRDVCAGKPPDMFLRDEKLGDLLTEFAADIRLAVFGHTHQDEMQLLHREPAGGTGPARVAVKLVASITPINGNAPSFTLAEVVPDTATLKDYRVVVADDRTGAQARWSESYRFSTAYRRTAFEAAQLDYLLEGFAADPAAATLASQAYQRNFFPGGGIGAMAIQLVWPTYVCAMKNDTVEGYRACACASKP